MQNVDIQRRILLVGNNHEYTAKLLTTLTEHNLTNEVKIARNGKEALDYLYRRNGFAWRGILEPALVMIDLSSPQVRGIDVLRQMKTDEKFKHIPVVVLTPNYETGNGKKHSITSAIEEYAGNASGLKDSDDDLLKNNLEQLMPSIKNALREAEETERLRRIEREAIERERMYTDLFETNPVPMWIYDTDSLGILEVNDAALELYGYTREEFMSMTIKDIRPEEEPPKLFENLAERNTLIEHTGIWKHKKKNGEIIFVEKVSHSLIEKAGRCRKLVSALNVTNKKLTDDALVSSEKKFRALIENSHEVIALLKGDGIALYVSPSVYSVLGYEPKELIDKYLFETVHPEDSEKINGIHDSALKHPHEKFEEQVRMTDRSGQWKWVEITLTNMLDERSVDAIVVNLRNITEGRRIEEQMRDSLEEKETLLKEIHHRVKNNFQLISSLLKLQSQYIEHKDLFEVLEVSQQRIKSMALIHQKLYQSGNYTEIDCGPYFDHLISDLISNCSLEGKQVSRIISINDISLNIETLIPLGLIINELVFNSLKHAFADMRNGKIEIELEKLNYSYVLTYRDNGAGIPEGTDISGSKSFGMQLVNTLVEQLEGTVEMKTSPGVEFRIRFKKLEYKIRI